MFNKHHSFLARTDYISSVSGLHEWNQRITKDNSSAWQKWNMGKRNGYCEDSEESRDTGNAVRSGILE